MHHILYPFYLQMNTPVFPCNEDIDSETTIKMLSGSVVCLLVDLMKTLKYSFFFCSTHHMGYKQVNDPHIQLQRINTIRTQNISKCDMDGCSCPKGLGHSNNTCVAD